MSRDTLIVDVNLAAYLAVRFVAWGRVGSSLEGPEMTGVEYFGVRDLLNRDDLVEQVLAAQRALETHVLLPPVPEHHLRVNHSIMVRTDRDDEGAALRKRWAVLDLILSDGLWPQAATTGRHSEDPNVVFFVADAPAGALNQDRVYNSYAPWVTCDLPYEIYDRDFRRTLGLSGPAKYGDRYLTSGWGIQNFRTGSVGTVSGVPPEFIVGMNGCPVEDFERAVGCWGRW